VNLGWPVFIEANDDGGGGDNWTTGDVLVLVLGLLVLVELLDPFVLLLVIVF